MTMTFTPAELEWCKRNKRERFHIEIPADMNARARSYLNEYRSNKKQAQERVMADFAGYYDPKEFVPADNWNSTNDAFVRAADAEQEHSS